jgi:hypothetical protein
MDVSRRGGRLILADDAEWECFGFIAISRRIENPHTAALGQSS